VDEDLTGDRGRRRVQAPGPTGAGMVPSVLSVMLEDDEEVAWTWQHVPGVGSRVVGYTIIKKPRPPARLDVGTLVRGVQADLVRAARAPRTGPSVRPHDVVALGHPGGPCVVVCEALEAGEGCDGSGDAALGPPADETPPLPGHMHMLDAGARAEALAEDPTHSLVRVRVLEGPSTGLEGWVAAWMVEADRPGEKDGVT
jgi:hypothetical protein